MASKPSKRLHLQRLIERNSLSAAEQVQILRSIESPSRAFLERVSKRGDPAKVSHLADQLLAAMTSAKADSESLSAQGPLEPDLVYREFLDADEIEKIHTAALPAAESIGELLGTPLDFADVLRIGCAKLKNEEISPNNLGLKPDVVERIQNQWPKIEEWDRNRLALAGDRE